MVVASSSITSRLPRPYNIIYSINYFWTSWYLDEFFIGRVGIWTSFLLDDLVFGRVNQFLDELVLGRVGPEPFYCTGC